MWSCDVPDSFAMERMLILRLCLTTPASTSKVRVSIVCWPNGWKRTNIMLRVCVYRSPLLSDTGPIVGIGFSHGANSLLNYLANDTAHQHRVVGALSVCQVGLWTDSVCISDDHAQGYDLRTLLKLPYLIARLVCMSERNLLLFPAFIPLCAHPQSSFYFSALMSDQAQR